jgi:hypothetical protein
MNKVTPYKDVSWYIKWIASYLLITATVLRAAGLYHTYDVALCAVGTAMWGYVGYRWNDRALTLINTVACLVLTTGLVKILFQ